MIAVIFIMRGVIMEAYKDDDCICHTFEDKINFDFPGSPGSDWNFDSECKAWRERSQKLKDNNIEFRDNSDEGYGCPCPTCGNMVCSWCA